MCVDFSRSQEHRKSMLVVNSFREILGHEDHGNEREPVIDHMKNGHDRVRDTTVQRVHLARRHFSAERTAQDERAHRHDRAGTLQRTVRNYWVVNKVLSSFSKTL